MNFEWKWTEAKKNYTKAIEFNPEYVQAHNLYGMIYLGWVEGKFEEAEAEGRIALKLEPLSAIDHADLAWTLGMARKFEEALTLANKVSSWMLTLSFASCGRLCYLALKRYEEAINTFSHLIKISKTGINMLSILLFGVTAAMGTCKKPEYR